MRSKRIKNTLFVTLFAIGSALAGTAKGAVICGHRSTSDVEQFTTMKIAVSAGYQQNECKTLSLPVGQSRAPDPKGADIAGKIIDLQKEIDKATKKEGSLVPVTPCADESLSDVRKRL